MKRTAYAKKGKLHLTVFLFFGLFLVPTPAQGYQQSTLPDNQPLQTPDKESNFQSQPRRHTSSPTSPPLYDKVCDVVLVIDNYIVRTYDPSNLNDLREKYTSYFNLVDLFYQNNFNTKLNLLHMHLEEGESFSDTMNDYELLSAFRHTLSSGSFGKDIPASACTYHLVTGRDTPEIGGLAWVGTSCDSSWFNTGFSVDENSQDESEDVIRRMIHELGHGFGGQHFDYYSSNPLYTCDAGISKESNRILRSAKVVPRYPNNLFISDCAMATMNSSMPSLSCLWGVTTRDSNLPMVTLYSGKNFKGTGTVVYGRNGLALKQCYNIVFPYGSKTSSFQLSSDVSGIRFFEYQDCVGQVFEFGNTSALEYVGDYANNKANSFQFIN